MSASQPVRFLLVGAGGYAVNLAVFALLHAAGTPYVAAAIASYVVSNALMYLGNRYVTFGLGHEGFWLAYLRYVLVGGVVAGLNAGILALLVERGGVNETLGLAISLLIVTPVAFVLNKRWTFGASGATPRLAAAGGADGSH
jgi:putative flippase GtrA